MFVKAPSDVLDFTWDWSTWLPTGDTISGVTWTVPSGPAIALVQVPENPAVTAHATGGTFSASTYYWVVTALGPTSGETTPCSQVSSAITANGSATLTWTQSPNAGGYAIYRSTTSGSGYLYVASVTGASTTSYIDTGTATTSRTPPGVNGADMTLQTSTTATVFLGSGTASNTYPITCQISTAGGRVAQWTQNLNVVNL